MLFNSEGGIRADVLIVVELAKLIHVFLFVRTPLSLVALDYKTVLDHRQGVSLDRL
jgi:hypothetical protein